MLVFVTGPVRSGKSRLALALALSRGRDVVIAVGARADDPEMERRIARHQAERPAHVDVIECATCNDWLERVPTGACLLVDCLGTVLGTMLEDLCAREAVATDADVVSAEAEERACALGNSLVQALVHREGPTIVVSNETGWGIVPAYPMGRLFRDVLGRANSSLAAQADAAWLVICGRALDLKSLPDAISWPQETMTP